MCTTHKSKGGDQSVDGGSRVCALSPAYTLVTLHDFQSHQIPHYAVFFFEATECQFSPDLGAFGEFKKLSAWKVMATMLQWESNIRQRIIVVKVGERLWIHLNVNNINMFCCVLQDTVCIFI